MPRYLTLLALISAVSGVACSAPPATSSSSASQPAAAVSAPAPAVPPAPVHDGRPIEISASDAMKYSVTEITAKPGEKLSVTLVNAGTTPKFSMGHNWVLLAPMEDVQTFLLVAAEAVTSDYVPTAKEKAHILASTKLLGPSERDTVTFTAPTAPGRYVFLCTFPGHYQVGMRGVLIVG